MGDVHEAGAGREERAAALQRQAAAAADALRDGEAWRAWLDTAARFPAETVDNQLLIGGQRPGATRVAGYRAWAAQGRQVRKGETAIWILAPGDTAAGPRAVAVFDIAQTDGPAVPPTPPLPPSAGGAAQDLWDALVRVITAQGYRVREGEGTGTDHRGRTVTVHGAADDPRAVLALAHQAGHVRLHADDGRPCAGTVRAEADGVAHLVAAAHGLQVGGFRPAPWEGRDPGRSARRVLDAARRLTGDRDPAANPGPDRLRAATAAAQAWFLEQASGSREYAAAVAERGYGTGEALGYGVGYAPAGWSGLVEHLLADGYTPAELLDAGVAAATMQGRLFDRFRGRVMFAIHDTGGIVGFTGRDTTGDPDTPKYLNSPAGPLFAKRRVLYGTQHIGHAPDRPVLVLAEGPWDALAVTASGGGQHVGVAACGTAVTGEHLDLIAGLGRGLLLAPDADPAGIAAMRRTLAMIAGRGEPHPAAVGPAGGKDLAELYALGGIEMVGEALDGARAAGIVYAEAHLAALPRRPSAEGRVAAARTAAACACGLTARERAQLRAVLAAGAGIGAEAAAVILGEVEPLVGVAALPRAAGGGLRR